MKHLIKKARNSITTLVAAASLLLPLYSYAQNIKTKQKYGETVVVLPGDLGTEIDAEENKKYNLGFTEGLEKVIVVKKGDGYALKYTLTDCIDEVVIPLNESEFSKEYREMEEKTGKKQGSTKSLKDLTEEYNQFSAELAKEADRLAFENHKDEYFYRYWERGFILEENYNRDYEVSIKNEMFDSESLNALRSTLRIRVGGENNGQFNGFIGTYTREDGTFKLKELYDIPDAYYLHQEIEALIANNTKINNNINYVFGFGFAYELDKAEKSIPEGRNSMGFVLNMEVLSEKWFSELRLKIASGTLEGIDDEFGNNVSYYPFTAKLKGELNLKEFGTSTSSCIGGEIYLRGVDYESNKTVKDYTLLDQRIYYALNQCDKDKVGLGVEIGIGSRTTNNEVTTPQTVGSIDVLLKRTAGRNVQLELGYRAQNSEDYEGQGIGSGWLLNLDIAF
jgi:hypothetical protein